MGMLVNLGDILRLPTIGDRPAYIDLRDPRQPWRVTAVELDRLIVGVARGLKRRGVRVGERVGILAENRLEFILSYLGIMRMGAVAVPVNFKLPATTIGHIFRDSRIALAFVDQPRAALPPAGVPVICYDRLEGREFTDFLDPGPLDTFIPREQDLAEILYTSGSTGQPKGVPLNHRGQCWALSRFCAELGEHTRAERTLVVAPLYHMNGLFFSTVALTGRMAIYSLPRFDARTYLRTVAEHRCTVLSGIPTMFAMMMRETALIAELDLGCVHSISIGSAPLTDALFARIERLFPNAVVSNGFGTTEAGPSVFTAHPDGLPKPPLALGYPDPDIRWRLLDGASPDEGVLALRTPALMGGYLNLPQVTAEKMRDGWYLTGDVMRRDGNGFFYFVGRSDDMFVCGGENIYPGEVEKLLEHHPAVAQAVVVPAPDDIKGQIPVAFVVARPGTQPTAEEIKQYALANGPAYAHPRLVEFRAQLPVSGTHKIDRSALTREAGQLARAAGRATEPAAAPAVRARPGRGPGGSPAGWLGYPRGTWLIIGIEFWERFSFYGMLAILALFLTGDVAHGGFGWSSAQALTIVGAYSGAMYAFPAFGGYLADRVLGRRRAVTLGASVMLLGQVLTASPTYLPALLGLWHRAPLLAALRSLGVPLGRIGAGAEVSAAIARRGAAIDPLHGVEWLRHAYTASTLGFYAALLLLILGNALMKSTLVVLCGETFEPGDPRRESAFAYYYLGISVGAMLSGFAVGVASERYGWPYGFGVAAVGMAVALGLYVLLGPRWLGHIGRRGGVVRGSHRGNDGTGGAPARAPRGETGLRIGLLLALAALMCAFSTGWFQMFGSWSLFIEHSVNRSLGAFVVPVAWFSSINATAVILVAPGIAALWVWLAEHDRRVDIIHKYCFALAMAMSGNALMFVAGILSAHGAQAPLWMPVLGVTLLGLGEIVAWTATYGFVSRAAPAGLASVTMGAWYLLTLGLGGYLSGVTGRWVDSIGYTATFAGIAAVMGGGAAAALALRGLLVRLAARANVSL
ncbi:MAG TPA: AMP-binding protein [Steroidobacteraceae bacterium]|nr:AMP-binding protein [Steroidobacteraceae bacterium]